MKLFIFSIVIMISAMYGIMVAYNHGKYVYVEPTFTQSAYQPNCFYDYYSNHYLVKDLVCPISDKSSDRVNTADSRNAQIILTALGVGHITDEDLTNGMKINDRTIILLHNEYVSQTEFNYLNSSEPDVIYLYPNAMFAQIEYKKITLTCEDYLGNNCYYQYQISLVRGHGYPSANITNGFNWVYENSQYELHGNPRTYDQCNGVDRWNTLPNGDRQLNCYTLNPIEITQAILQGFSK